MHLTDGGCTWAAPGRTHSGQETYRWDQLRRKRHSRKSRPPHLRVTFPRAWPAECWPLLLHARGATPGPPAVRGGVCGEPVGWCTAFEVDADCEGVPLYLLWITDPDSLAHVNQARAG